MNTPKPPAITQDPERGDRIAKVLARLGVASRRDAEKLIAEGRVSLNDVTVTTPATFVQAGDSLAVDGERLGRRQKTRLFLYHKPPGLITTSKDPEGRATVFESLPQNLPRLISVGRLDLNTEGLLLLTNDGAVSRMLELPSSGLARTYRVRVHAGGMGGLSVLERKLKTLDEGFVYKGVRYGSIMARVDAPDSANGTNIWVTMTLSEGKNREIRNVMEALGYQVTRLIRISYGPFELGDMNRGEVIEVSTKAMREQLPPEIGTIITG